MIEDLEDPETLARVMRRYDVSPIVRRFGAWAVTTYGIESLTSYYPIELSRVDESDWLKHMSEKTWVDISEFSEALNYAKSLHRTRQELSIDGRALRVFLCHANEDKDPVRRLRHQLLAMGTDPWLDEDKLVPGQDWKLEINRALRRSDIVIACLSKNSVTKTGFVQRELREAIEAASERPPGQIFIIPARLDDGPVPDSLERLQRVDLFVDDGLFRLTNALRHFANSRGHAQ
jgi:hypothetical protein